MTTDVLNVESTDAESADPAVRARGFQAVDDNEADAIAILVWSLETHGGVR